MKRNPFHLLSCGAVAALALWLCCWHLDYELPSRQRALQVFGGEERLKNLAPQLAALRAETYDGYVQGIFLTRKDLSAADGPKGAAAVTPIPPKAVLNGMRSYLLGTSDGDGQQTLGALSRINLKRLDFDPKFYSYGGAYLFFVAFALAATGLTGLFRLTSDITYYLLHQGDVAAMYLTIRSVGVLSVLGIMAVLHAIGKRTGRWQGLLAALVFVTQPSVLDTVRAPKPHLFGAFWMCLMFALCLRALEKDDVRTVIFLGFAGGLGVGSSLPNAALFAIFLGLAALMICRRRGTAGLGGRMAIAVGAGLAAFLATNFYLLFSIPSLLLNIRFHSTTYRYGLVNVHGFLEYLKFAGANYWILMPLLFAGFWALLQRRSAADLFLLWSSLAGSVVFGFVFSAPRLGATLYALFSLVAGEGAEWLVSRGRWRRSAGVLLAALLALSAARAIGHVLPYARRNPLEAGTWINAHIPPGSSIGLPTGEPHVNTVPPMRFLDYELFQVPAGADLGAAGRLPDYLVLTGKPAEYAFGRDGSLGRFYRETRRFEAWEPLPGLLSWGRGLFINPPGNVEITVHSKS